MAAPTTEHKLAKETELRLEVGRGKDVAVTLLEGSAEVFGAELALGRRAPLPGGGAYAVFTWDGATIAVEGDPDVACVVFL
jgi:polyribonucleotide 5'-hydroxyl-kinase